MSPSEIESFPSFPPPRPKTVQRPSPAPVWLIARCRHCYGLGHRRLDRVCVRLSQRGFPLATKRDPGNMSSRDPRSEGSRKRIALAEIYPNVKAIANWFFSRTAPGCLLFLLQHRGPFPFLNSVPCGCPLSSAPSGAWGVFD